MCIWKIIQEVFIINLRSVPSSFFVPKIFTSMIYSAMSFPLKVLWVVKKLHHLASPKWIFIHHTYSVCKQVSNKYNTYFVWTPCIFGSLLPRVSSSRETGGSDLMAMTYTIGYEKKNINHHCTPAVSPFIS